MVSESEAMSNAEPNSPSDGASRLKEEPLPLFRQSSIYSLTLDELEQAVCEPGKNLGSMNMDEFISNIWSAEENQALQVAMEANHSQNQFPNRELTRQGSLSLPPPLSGKRVEEVWSDIQNQPLPAAAPMIHRQTTFGEMTLEDFLVRAGVVRDDPVPLAQCNGDSGVVGSGTGNIVGNGGFGLVGGSGPYAMNGGVPALASVPLSLGYGAPLSPLSSDGAVDGGYVDAVRGGSRKRVIAGPVEKVVERRQRRMIKNRESAARSRARKQAYTVELEAELEKLRKENARLKKEHEEEEKARRKKLLELLNSKVIARSKAKPKHLKRTLTAPW